MTLSEIKELKAKYEAAIKSGGKELVKELFKELLDLPEVGFIRWHQYTPYFNDGDSCRFGVGEISVNLKGGDAEAGDYGDGFLSAYELKEKPAIQSALRRLELNFDGMDDILEAAFGDHAEVTVTREAITIERYDHD